MFVNDRIVFVELHKTGGTHIGKWLKRLVGGEQIGKHNRVPPDLRDRFIIGSVRNPWDWYVSLWAYGCAGKGSVHRQTTRRVDLSYIWRQLGPEMGAQRLSARNAARQCIADMAKPAAEWRSVYRDVTDARAFQRWLRMVMDPSNRFHMGEGFGFSPVSHWGGLMTYRYIKLFSRLDDALYLDPKLETIEGSREALRSNRLVDFFIRNEALEEDLLTALARSGIMLSEHQREDLRSAKKTKTNASTRLQTAGYYDSKSIALIAKKEALIIANHDYTPP